MGKTETTTIAQPNTEQQQSLRQLSTLLSQTPITSLPTALKTDVGTRLTSDALYSTLVKLIQQQPATLGPDTALGKNILNYLLQSQLALSPDHWQNLPLPLKGQLTQSGILPPSGLATPPQRQLIQQITSQIFSLLAQPKSTPTMSTTPLAVNSGQTTVASVEINTSSNEVQLQTTLQGSANNLRSIDLALKTFLQSLPQETASIPQPVKELIQQLRSLLQQPMPNASSNEPLPRLPSRLQPLINNPLLNEINNQPATTVSINRIQNALNTLNTPIASGNTTIGTTNSSLSPIDSKTVDILNRWLFQLAAPKIMQSGELLTQIKTMSPMPIWLPATTDEWHQYQNSFELLQDSTIQLTQQLQAAIAILPTTSPKSANDASLKTTVETQNENSIFPVQATKISINISTMHQWLFKLFHVQMPSGQLSVQNTNVFLQSGFSNIEAILKTSMQSLPQETTLIPQPVKVMIQQLRSLLEQTISDSSNDPLLQTTLPSRLQPLINNPLLNEINNQPATTISINRIQNALNTLNPPIASGNTTIGTTNSSVSPIDSKTVDILNRWLLQLTAPKIMQSGELLTQIKTMSPMPIWLPATTDEWHQYQNGFESLQDSTIQLTQQLQAAIATLPTTSPISANDASLKTTVVTQNENSILPIQAVSRNDKGNNIAVLQQLLTSLQQALPRLGAPVSTETLPVSLNSAAELLLQQFSSPLQTSDHVRSWMQFLLQPLDSDGAYGKAMQQWLVQLLQFRAKTNQAVQQTKSNTTEQNHLQNQLNALDKLSEQSVESFRMPSQPTPGSNGQIPSLLHFPLPPQNSGEEPGSLNLQRNTREDNERGWNISLSLEPGKLGPIRFQARIALPEITLSIVAEKTATVDLIKQTYPLLEQRFQSLGLTPQTLQIRQGKIKKETSTAPNSSSGFSVKV
ncbi:flagellar hook-length control protein FliK [uncultured Tolumonas sp.]|uniref:flagellar hook-length control protein FliK n=1 Tax=uncultured Tolumonas sp. TaxID=263765 RepID=UPI00292E0053